MRDGQMRTADYMELTFELSPEIASVALGRSDRPLGSELTSSVSLQRFSMEPPYLSLLLFEDCFINWSKI